MRATRALYAVYGVVVGVWTALVPAVQRHHGLSHLVLGSLLLALAAGAALSAAPAAWAVHRWGTRRVAVAGSLAACALLPVVPVAPGLLTTGAALLALGGAVGTIDLSCNAHGVWLGESIGRPVLPGIHAAWSAGGIAGALVVATAGAVRVSVTHAVVGVAVTLVAVVLACAGLVGVGTMPLPDRAGVSLRAVAPLAAMAVLVMLAEGVLTDWAGLYLRDHAGASGTLAPLSVAAVSAGLLAGRLRGGAWAARLGPVPVLRWGGLSAAAAVVALLVLPHPVAGLAALLLAGVALANGVPLLVGLAGAAAGPAGIAAVSAAGTGAFVAGPPAVGLLADVTSLPWALALLVPAALMLAALAGRAATRA